MSDERHYVLERSAERYCMSTNKWELIAPLPRENAEAIACTVLTKDCRHYIVIIGGVRHLQDDSLIYDPLTNSYQTICLSAPTTSIKCRRSCIIDNNNNGGSSLMIMIGHYSLLSTWILPYHALLEAIISPPVPDIIYPIAKTTSTTTTLAEKMGEATMSSSSSSSSIQMIKKVDYRAWYQIASLPGFSDSISCMAS
jgi:hypothetical protein